MRMTDAETVENARENDGLLAEESSRELPGDPGLTNGSDTSDARGQ